MGDSLRGKQFEYQGREYKVLEERGERLVIAPCEGAGERKLVLRDEYNPGPVSPDGSGESGDTEPKPKPQGGSSGGAEKKPSGGDGDKKPPSGGGEKKPEGSETEDVLAGNVPDIEKAVTGIDDAETLGELLERENASEKPRTGAVKALEARIEELAEAKE